MVKTVDFNKDMDKYLKSRKEDDRFFSLNFKKEKKPKVQETMTVFEDEEKKPGFLARIFGFSKTEEEDVLREDLNEEEMRKLQRMQGEIKEVKELEEKYPEEFDELEEVREGLLSRFFSNLKLFRNTEKVNRKAEELDMIEREIIPQMDDDVREVLKIIHKWLEKLDKETKSTFKRSNDFQIYKDLLEKYDLVKKK